MFLNPCFSDNNCSSAYNKKQQIKMERFFRFDSVSVSLNFVCISSQPNLVASIPLQGFMLYFISVTTMNSKL